MTFRAVGLPSQCALVPSARVTLSGLKPFCLVNASYVSVVDGFKYLGPFRQRYINVAHPAAVRNNRLALSNGRSPQHSPQRRECDMLIVCWRSSLATEGPGNGGIDCIGNCSGLSSWQGRNRMDDDAYRFAAVLTRCQLSLASRFVLRSLAPFVCMR